MRTPGNETVIVKPELIRLVRRDDSKKWQAHYKLENLKTWFRRSTDTANVKEASKIAERMWMKASCIKVSLISLRTRYRSADAHLMCAFSRPVGAQLPFEVERV